MLSSLTTSVVSLQLGCSKGSHRLATPVSVMLSSLTTSVVSLQLGCSKASHRLVSVIAFIGRTSVVSLQLGCCKASHRLATPVTVILVVTRPKLVNFLTTNVLITSTCSSVKFMSNKFSSDTRQCSLFGELQTRCIPDSVSCVPPNVNSLTVTNLSEHLCCASPASSLFSSLIMSNTNDAPMQSTSDKSPKAMMPFRKQNACRLFLMNFLANSLF